MTENQVRTGQGRRRRSRGEIERLVAAFQASGLSQREFAKRNEISVNSLGAYVRRSRRSGSHTTQAEPWVAVEVASPNRAPGDLTLVLSGGRRIEVGWASMRPPYGD
ncbi:MAG: IS66 family insertion sequence element accessory protein TnpA [Bryobacteraceae bacterium]